MKPLSFKRRCFPPNIIQRAIWLYARSTLSFRDVEELLAERGIDTLYEAVRRWMLKPTLIQAASRWFLWHMGRYLGRCIATAIAAGRPDLVE
jgi:transposase-like protein